MYWKLCDERVMIDWIVLMDWEWTTPEPWQELNEKYESHVQQSYFLNDNYSRTFFIELYKCLFWIRIGRKSRSISIRCEILNIYFNLITKNGLICFGAYLILIWHLFNGTLLSKCNFWNSSSDGSPSRLIIKYKDE